MIQYTITNEPKQSFIIPFDDNKIYIDIEFLTIIERWVININFRDFILNGVALNSAVMVLDTYNLPFDIYVNDLTGVGVDPFDVDNFKGLYEFYIIPRDELEIIRGYEVE